MTPQERQLLGGLFQRVASTASNSRDPEAESFISDAVRMQPHAPYALAQTVLVQQQALEAAAKRIQELEEQSQSQNPPQQEGGFLGNLGRSLFGGGQSAPQPRSGYDASAYTKQPGAPPPPPQSSSYGAQPSYSAQPSYGAQQPYPPQQNYGSPPGAGGPWGAQAPAAGGGGFLQSALTTAAGVAGGVMAADALKGLFGGGHGGFGLGGGSGLGQIGGGETIVNNYYDGADPGRQHAQDVLQDADQDQDAQQDADQDQDDLQDASDNSGGFDDNSSFDT
jgi:hypothetical protein